MPKTVDCPGCGRSQPQRTADTIYWCDVCQCQFDDSPDEGGDYGTDPTRRIQRQEERAERERERKVRRR